MSTSIDKRKAFEMFQFHPKRKIICHWTSFDSETSWSRMLVLSHLCYSTEFANWWKNIRKTKIKPQNVDVPSVVPEFLFLFQSLLSIRTAKQTLHPLHCLMWNDKNTKPLLSFTQSHFVRRQSSNVAGGFGSDRDCKLLRKLERICRMCERKYARITTRMKEKYLEKWNRCVIAISNELCRLCRCLSREHIWHAPMCVCLTSQMTHFRYLLFSYYFLMPLFSLSTVRGDLWILQCDKRILSAGTR